jgi:hypothetical protein
MHLQHLHQPQLLLHLPLHLPRQRLQQMILEAERLGIQAHQEKSQKLFPIVF